MLEKLGAYFRLVQRNKVGAVIGCCIIVILGSGYMNYQSSSENRAAEKAAKLRELRCQQEKDSIIRAFQGYLIQQLKEVREVREALDTSTNYIDKRNIRH